MGLRVTPYPRFVPLVRTVILPGVIVVSSAPLGREVIHVAPVAGGNCLEIDAVRVATKAIVVTPPSRGIGLDGLGLRIDLYMAMGRPGRIAATGIDTGVPETVRGLTAGLGPPPLGGTGIHTGLLSPARPSRGSLLLT